MNKSSTKPIFVLAILSFMLTLSHYGGVNSSVLEPQFSINTATVEQSLNAKSRFDAIESNQTVGTAAVLSAGIVIVGILSLMKGKNSFKWVRLRNDVNSEMNLHPKKLPAPKAT